MPAAPHRTVAVTGGSGQLGTLVIRRLANNPHVERIVAIDRRPPMVSSAKIKAVIADVRDPGLSRQFENCDGLIHCAALVADGASADLIRSVNVDGGKNVFRAAVAAGVKTIVHMSSVTVYGCRTDHPVPIVEDSPRTHERDFPYASSKFELEEFLDAFEPEHPDVAISRIRANILVGRHMRHLLGWSFHAGWIPNLGGAPLPLVWDEDVADLVILALRARARGPFNASVEELLDSDALAERVGLRSMTPARPLLFSYRVSRGALASVGLSSLFLSDPVWFDKMKGVTMIASSARAMKELGWSPRYPTATAVLKQFREVVPLGLDGRVQLLLTLWARRLNRRSEGLPVRSCRINLCLDGRTGRDLTLAIEAGKLRVESGPQPAPTSTVMLRDPLFRALLIGAVDADRERREGRIIVEGEEADWDVFKCIVDGVVALQRGEGVRAAILRRMTSWVTRSNQIGGSPSGGSAR